VEKLAKERYKFLPLSDSNLLPISVVGRKTLPDAKTLKHNINGSVC
jgi:hypothetical protein